VYTMKKSMTFSPAASEKVVIDGWI
jgi:hypothetical protein